MPKDRKASMLSVRTSAELREKLDVAAEESGRSLTQEVEMRIERSFQADSFVGGDRNAAFLSVLGASIKEIELKTGQSWLSDKDTWQEVAELVSGFIYDREPQVAERPTLLPRNERTIAKHLPGMWSENGDQI